MIKRNEIPIKSNLMQVIFMKFLIWNINNKQKMYQKVVSN